MNVSKNSWHYKLYNLYMNVWHKGPEFWIDLLDDKGLRYYRDYKPTNLCRYFWSIVLSTIAAPIFLTGLAVITLIIFVIGYPIFRLVMWIQARKAANRAHNGLEPKPAKQPSLIAEFVKAKKAKACPVITVVD